MGGSDLIFYRSIDIKTGGIRLQALIIKCTVPVRATAVISRRVCDIMPR